MDCSDSNEYNESMKVLTIRNITEQMHKRLRMRAARAGRSMEAEIRFILQQACNENSTSKASPEDLCEFVSDLYEQDIPSGVVDELIANRRKEAMAE